MTPVEAKSWFMKSIAFIAGLLLVLVIVKVLGIENQNAEMFLFGLATIMCIVAFFLNKKADQQLSEVEDENA